MHYLYAVTMKLGHFTWVLAALVQFMSLKTRYNCQWAHHMCEWKPNTCTISKSASFKYVWNTSICPYVQPAEISSCTHTI